LKRSSIEDISQVLNWETSNAYVLIFAKQQLTSFF